MRPKSSSWLNSRTGTWLGALIISSSPAVFGVTQPLRLNASTIKNWGIINNIGKERSHIQALEAWRLEEGSRNVVVAVIDTGVDVNHKDLGPNIWRDPLNPQSKVQGWNFVTN